MRRWARRAAPPAALLLAFWAAGCGDPGLGPQEACRLAGDHVLEPDDDEYQQLVQDHYPPSGYRDVEIVECTEFLSKSEEGWASVRVHARGSEFDLDTGRALGRTIFSMVVELEETPDGWRVIEKGRF